MSAKRTLTLSTINDITTRINSEQDLSGLLQMIMETARYLLNTEASSLLLYDEESEDLVFDIVRGPRGGVLANRRIPKGKGIAGLCAEKREPIIVNDAVTDSRVMRSFDAESNFETRNLLAIPMVARGGLIGVLEVVNTTDGRQFEKHDVNLLSYLSDMAAIAIHNRKLYEDLKNRADELNCLYEISQKIGFQNNREDLLDTILEAIQNVLDVERVSVLLKTQGEVGEQLKLVRLRGFSLDDHDYRIDPDEGIAGIVFKTGDPLLVRDVEKDLKILSDRVGRYKTKSFICVPIMREGKVVGIINAADKKNGEPFDLFELQVLSTVATQLADGLSRIEAKQKELELGQYKKDLETAAQIQINSLPEIPARLAGLQIAYRYEACRDVGGDFYDLIFHSENRISVLIADVAGKGVPAALFMEYSKTLLASHIPRNLDPVTTLSRVNQEIFRKSRTGIFVTTMLVQIETDRKRMRIASAGHNNQILYRTRQKRLEKLRARGTPLGIFEDAEYIENVVDFEKDDLLILYTDGITEANNPALEEFGEERLFELVENSNALGPQDFIVKVFESLDQFRGPQEPADDTTIMAIRL
ncbi:MAG: SpoIIE family protein phosphatase [Spirochaetia bacterium]|nr:SpoIIE family protein phosphatase [Spirochaetia bacterium]